MAGVFWVHSKSIDGHSETEAVQQFTQTDEIDESSLPYDTTAPELESVRSDTSPIPVIALDYAAIRRLVPEGTSPLSLVNALLDGEQN